MTQSPHSAEPATLAAVVTAYHPDKRLAAVIDAALASCAAVIVADNTPEGSPSLADELDDPRVLVLRSGHNRGLAGALNLGLDHLPADAEAVLFLDQDSVLPAELVTGLLAHLQDPAIGVVGPTPVDAETGGRYERGAERHETLDDRPSIITSGMLVRRACLDTVGRFREDFFVDCVDTDFCLRVRRSGSRVVRDAALVLPHSIGSGRDHRVGPLTVRVLHYPAWRHYWIARNGLVLSREFAGERSFVLTNALFTARWLVVTALFDERRRSSVPAVLQGLAHGLTGRVSRRRLPAGAEYAG
ncbi:glycosyltransferase family 2 protein [Actinospica durhamensis]|uniref:Glycosyltransferase family 2 protein n=1 Tax=Actinospica durhamensis TaxID=1508375 RepID=A0A941ING7_9ACTN|nr:glycosyltransferase family 2 protein [Actinospica durhamensis]MBR7833954.1 glycosyltransferase family 2 protein [Actinospica durhamensis]